MLKLIQVRLYIYNHDVNIIPRTAQAQLYVCNFSYNILSFIHYPKFKKFILPFSPLLCSLCCIQIPQDRGATKKNLDFCK
ncbi:hypothetical protein TorRG33x02_107650 [Trema orientale]|uniref:Uncharacterized protein n=1 Tax=Trema orientale TaxID=63057 RepID=A0A2P5F6S8_TREOI|nr:hypothetical protein TorRG33x02_107650 [Trema orientale]